MNPGNKGTYYISSRFFLALPASDTSQLEPLAQHLARRSFLQFISTDIALPSSAFTPSLSVLHTAGPTAHTLWLNFLTRTVVSIYLSPSSRAPSPTGSPATARSAAP